MNVPGYTAPIFDAPTPEGPPMTLLHQAAQQAVALADEEIDKLWWQFQALDDGPSCQPNHRGFARAVLALQQQEVPDLSEILSGETMTQREEVCEAWSALPDDLRKDPRMKRLYLALGGVRMDGPVETVSQEVPRG